MGNVTFRQGNVVEYGSDSTLDFDIEANVTDNTDNCDSLCYDCDKGSYCWKSEIENQNS